MKRLMIIAGGEWQVPIIREAKDMGLFVVNTNLYHNSPGFEFSDVGLVVDVQDKIKNLEYAREFKVDAVITDQTDIAVNTVSYVAENLNLPGIGSKVSALFTNKYLMRKFCFDNYFPVPQFQLCLSLEEARQFVESNGLPVVVKPPSSQSSRGVTKVTHASHLNEAFFSALSHSNDGSVLLEDFLGGVELTVDGIKLNAGNHFCLATSCKKHCIHNQMIANHLCFSREHPDIDYSLLHHQHNRMIKEMGLSFGLTHAEYKYYKGGFYLIEVAARGGGTRISSDIVPLMSNINSNELVIRMALGEEIESIYPMHNEKFVALDFFEFESGTVKSISGVEKARAIEGVIDIGLSVKKGDSISPASDDRSRHGFAITFSQDYCGLKALKEKINQVIEISYE